jgi:hypothetical protein
MMLLGILAVPTRHLLWEEVIGTLCCPLLIQLLFIPPDQPQNLRILLVQFHRQTHFSEYHMVVADRVLEAVHLLDLLPLSICTTSNYRSNNNNSNSNNKINIHVTSRRQQRQTKATIRILQAPHMVK